MTSYRNDAVIAWEAEGMRRLLFLEAMIGLG